MKKGFEDWETLTPEQRARRLDAMHEREESEEFKAANRAIACERERRKRQREKARTITAAILGMRRAAAANRKAAA